jgi:hypothetical protein
MIEEESRTRQFLGNRKEISTAMFFLFFFFQITEEKIVLHVNSLIHKNILEKSDVQRFSDNSNWF